MKAGSHYLKLCVSGAFFRIKCPHCGIFAEVALPIQASDLARAVEAFGELHERRIEAMDREIAAAARRARCARAEAWA